MQQALIFTSHELTRAKPTALCALHETSPRLRFYLQTQAKKVIRFKCVKSWYLPLRYHKIV